MKIFIVQSGFFFSIFQEGTTNGLKKTIRKGGPFHETVTKPKLLAISY
jgi:hypothetical protein